MSDQGSDQDPGKDLRVFDWPFRDPRTEMMYVSDPRPGGAAIGSALSPESRRSRLREARSYHRKPLSFKARYRVCRVAATVEDVDPDSVRALRHDIEAEPGEWAELVEWVRLEWEFYRDVERVAYETSLPLQDVVAILEDLAERGALPLCE